MLITIVFLINLLSTQVFSVENGKDVKSYVVYPLPIEMPNRNDRAEQCWVRVEDIELTHMIAIYCHLAHEFLHNYIYEYNNRKMMEDNVDVSLWKEPRTLEKDLNPPKSNPNSNVKDWRTTTILDSITHMRLYVSLKADCRLIMYSREGTSNYKVDCERILYFVNSRTSSSGIPCANISLIVMAGVLIWLMSL